MKNCIDLYLKEAAIVTRHSEYPKHLMKEYEKQDHDFSSKNSVAICHFEIPFFRYCKASALDATLFHKP